MLAHKKPAMRDERRENLGSIAPFPAVVDDRSIMLSPNDSVDARPGTSDDPSGPVLYAQPCRPRPRDRLGPPPGKICAKPQGTLPDPGCSRDRRLPNPD